MLDKSGIAKANTILSVIEEEIGRSEIELICVNMYSNGREQGYHLINNEISQEAVSFAESRGSDNIVVYTGKAQDFDNAGNVPDEDVCMKGRHFSPNAYIKAARYIIKSLGIK